MAENKGIMVLAEVRGGKPAAITAELLGGGRKLADDLGEELSAVLAGGEVAGLAGELIAAGADKVYLVEDPRLADYQPDAYTAVMEKVARETVPRAMLMGQTAIGRDLAPRLAFRLKTAATLDCVELAVEGGSGRLLQTKPVYGGNALAVFSGDTFPQVATVRAKVMTPLEPDASRQGETVPFAVEPGDADVRTRLLEKIPREEEGIRLEDAGVVVSGGRGIGSAEGFKQLEELAGLLKGAVGGTRPTVDNGWLPDQLQVGLTGRIVAPELYIAVALSGASQHMSGCSGSKNIVAINRDAEANIFREARFGVAGDWKKVLPAFTEKLRELLAE